ncbi:DUF2779 domain-containing protein [Synechocystis sp. LKSZ1]|uniref:DUF2779 domain-containing protein n=1 Tax=Synechocystis sp. LKSZ1 TaxID=3144951 RepID=UPI00336BDEDD
MSFPISKTYFLAGLQCPKRLWLAICKPEWGTPPSIAEQQRIKQGLAIGIAARESFPEGILLQGTLDVVLEQTQQLIEQGVTCLLEPAFIFDDILVRCDVLRKLPTGHWEIIEVKSSTKVKEEHIPDLALQQYVLEGLGLVIERTSLMSVNPLAHNWQDVQERFNINDVTQQVQAWLKQLPQRLGEFRYLLSQSDPPDTLVGKHCDRPYPCVFKAHCWQGIPSLSIFNIPRLPTHKLQQLLEQNILELKDIPADFPLTTAQRSFVERMIANQPLYDSADIQAKLAQLQFPLHFFDVETLNPAMPRFPGLRPYSRCVFQYSCHILRDWHTLEHYSYLHPVNSDPRLSLVESLMNHIEPQGSIVVYNQSFEASVLRQLASDFPEYAKPLQSIIDRLWDLQLIFKQTYHHPGFQGSTSLKRILPVLVPALSYDFLTVKSGQEAPLVWEAMVACEDPQQRAEMMQHLQDYCSLDTLGMVEIYRFLVTLMRSEGLEI